MDTLAELVGAAKHAEHVRFERREINNPTCPVAVFVICDWCHTESVPMGSQSIAEHEAVAHCAANWSEES